MRFGGLAWCTENPREERLRFQDGFVHKAFAGGWWEGRFFPEATLFVLRRKSLGEATSNHSPVLVGPLIIHMTHMTPFWLGFV